MKKVKLYNNGETEIIIFSEKEPLIEGQTTIFNTIIIEESVFSKYNQDAQDYILMHEYAHTKQKIISFLFIPLMVISSLFALASFTFIILTLMLFLIKYNYVFLYYSISGFLLLFFAIGVFSTSSWFLEIDADYYTIKNIGKKKVINAISDIKMKNASKTKFFRRLVGRLTHPPLWVIIKIYDFMNSN